jgi:hydroxymethylglutaryl-CoA lyase
VSMPEVVLNEECMREGMQIESVDIPVEEKLELLDILSETGLKNINVGAFVSERYTPQMANIDAILKAFVPRPDVRYYYLALNERGHERARQFDFLTPRVSRNTAGLSYHMCGTFLRRNANISQQDEILNWPRIVANAVEQGGVDASIGVNAAWGSNFEGGFSLDQRMEVLRHQHALWEEAGIPVRRIALGDPMGWNMPHLVREQLGAIQKEWPAIDQYALHLHNARGMALPSIYAAIEVLDEQHKLSLETTAGGIGGCPYAGLGRANGMAATEDVVHMLEAMGVDTGVDLEKLIRFVWLLEDVIGRRVPGHVAHAGPFPTTNELFDPNLPLVETHEEALHFLRGPDVFERPVRPWRQPIPSPFASLDD